MNLGETRQYKEAFEALKVLKTSLGTSPELKAIAAYLLYSNGVEVPPTSMFPWVGIDNPYDIAGVRAYSEAWQRFLTDDPDIEDGDFL